MINKVLRAAEAFDAARVVPRVFMGLYMGWSAYLIEQIVWWYIHLPAAERTVNDAGFVTATIAAVTGFIVPLFRIYSENGRDWQEHPAPPIAPPMPPSQFPLQGR